MKGFALGLTLKQRRKATRKSSIIFQVHGLHTVAKSVHIRAISFSFIYSLVCLFFGRNRRRDPKLLVANLGFVVLTVIDTLFKQGNSNYKCSFHLGSAIPLRLM